MSKKFSSRTWLNGKGDPSTGSICCYHGPAPWSPDRTDTYLEVSDCHNSIRLHRTKVQSKKDFIRKLKLMKSDLNDFINFLEKS